MRSIVAAEHRYFFSKNGFIEFEDFFTEEKIKTLEQMGMLALGKRVRCLPENLFHSDPDPLFLAGRDLWRDDPQIQKQLLFPTLSMIASSLLQENTLRIAFDHLMVFSGKCPKGLEKTVSLDEISSIYPLRCGCIFYLTPPQISPDSKFIPVVKTPKSVLFFRSNLPIEWSKLYAQPHCIAWIIAFAAEKAHYRLQKADPCVHALKKLGYGFGDALSHETHPVHHQTIKNLA